MPAAGRESKAVNLAKGEDGSSEMNDNTSISL